MSWSVLCDMHAPWSDIWVRCPWEPVWGLPSPTTEWCDFVISGKFKFFLWYGELGSQSTLTPAASSPWKCTLIWPTALYWVLKVVVVTNWHFSRCRSLGLLPGCSSLRWASCFVLTSHCYVNSFMTRQPWLEVASSFQTMLVLDVPYGLIWWAPSSVNLYDFIVHTREQVIEDCRYEVEDLPIEELKKMPTSPDMTLPGTGCTVNCRYFGENYDRKMQVDHKWKLWRFPVPEFYWGPCHLLEIKIEIFLFHLLL